MAPYVCRHNDPVVRRTRPWFLLLMVMLASSLLCGSPRTSFAKGTFDRARSQVRAAHAQALLDEGRGEYERAHYFRAIRVLSAAISGSAGAEAFQLRGAAYQQAGEFDKALEDFSSAISLSPSDPGPYVARGDLFNHLLDYEKALIDFDKALELSPASTAARLGRGLANTGLERYASAVTDFEAALSNEDRNPEVLWNLGTAHMLAGRPGAAKKALQDLLQLESDAVWQQRTRDRIAQLPPGPDLDLGPSEESLHPNEHVRPRSTQDTSPESAARQTDAAVAAGQPSIDESGNLQRPADTEAIRKFSVAGTWQTTYLGHKIDLNAQQVGGSISGVLRIHSPGGGDDTYHFRGRVGEDGSVWASHHSGHRFSGRLLPGKRLSGVLTTNNGAQIPLVLSPD